MSNIVSTVTRHMLPSPHSRSEDRSAATSEQFPFPLRYRYQPCRSRECTVACDVLQRAGIFPVRPDPGSRSSQQLLLSRPRGMELSATTLCRLTAAVTLLWTVCYPVSASPAVTPVCRASVRSRVSSIMLASPRSATRPHQCLRSAGSRWCDGRRRCVSDRAWSSRW